MAFRLGVDVGGTFTDLLLFQRRQRPVLALQDTLDAARSVRRRDRRRACGLRARGASRPQGIDVFLHGTTVATNAVLEGKGARVGLVVSEGYRQMMQIARSLVPGGLAGWIVWPEARADGEAGRHGRSAGSTRCRGPRGCDHWTRPTFARSSRSSLRAESKP